MSDLSKSIEETVRNVIGSQAMEIAKLTAIVKAQGEQMVELQKQAAEKLNGTDDLKPGGSPSDQDVGTRDEAGS